MTYPEAIKYLDSFIDYEKIPQYPYKQSLKLERIKEFLSRLNNPQDDLECIHIAGTKGKGSTCAFIAYILREAQFKVGFYTSPHLSDFKERIRILDPRPLTPDPRPDFEGMISCEELTALVERLRPYIESYNSQSKYGALSFFEIYTALAFVYFKEKKIDFAVLETGLGGRLDATNMTDSLIAAITPISHEHTKQLGRTLAEIAYEKAGIIKRGNGGWEMGNDNFCNPHPVTRKPIVITAPQEKEVIEVIRDRCRKENAILYEIGKDIIFEEEKTCHDSQCFNINGVFGRLADLKIRLLGRHQIINATLAVAVILALSRFYQARLNPLRNITLSAGRAKISNGVNVEAIRNGLYNTAWPGRFEIILENPWIVLDGAQNLASAQALKQTLIENFPGKRIILVLGISQDKDIEGICQELVPISDEVILTQADNPRAADVDVIEQVVRSMRHEAGSRIFKIKSVKNAIELARKKARKEDLILVTGSLFLVGQVRDLFKIRNAKY